MQCQHGTSRQRGHVTGDAHVKRACEWLGVLPVAKTLDQIWPRTRPVTLGGLLNRAWCCWAPELFFTVMVYLLTIGRMRLRMDNGERV